MKDTWLVQRLLAPTPGLDNAPRTRAHHIFGGSMLGLTPEQWAVLDPIFEIDYMGAAEFEWGIFPRTIAEMLAKSERLVGFVFELKKAHIPAHWTRQNSGPGRKKKAAENADIYVVCAVEQKPDVAAHIAEIVRGDRRLKETGMFEVLDPPEAPEDPSFRASRLRGWLDLNNQYFFFSSREMWEKTCALLGLQAEGDGFVGKPKT